MVDEMKVVINTCYGGFGLSAKARNLAYARKSPAIEAYDLVGYYGSIESAEERTKRYLDDMKFGHIAVAPDGKILCVGYGNDVRCDPVIVGVVEELGEEANDTYSKLKVVNVPDGIEFEISDYDGKESVHERHEVWD